MFNENNLINTSNINIIIDRFVEPGGIEGYVSELKNCMDFDRLSPTVSNSIYSVFIEQMNNVLMYSEENVNFTKVNDVRGKGHFLFGENDDMFFMQSINIIKDDNIEHVKSKIDHLNALDKTEMRQYYKECIKAENTNINSKGAGLGLIDIAKRADEPIEYMFKPYENGFSYFTMLIKINKR